MAVAACAMRQVLVDRARARFRLKRGRGSPRSPRTTLAADESSAEILLDLDRALAPAPGDATPSSSASSSAAIFGGLSEGETAEALGLSLRTAQRAWMRARAWLRAELEGRPEPPVIERDDWPRLDALLDEALDRRKATARRSSTRPAGRPGGRAPGPRLLALAADDDRLLAGGGLRGPMWDDLAQRDGGGRTAVLRPGAAGPLRDPRPPRARRDGPRLPRLRSRSSTARWRSRRSSRTSATTRGSLRRFEREARLLATLNHPNVAAIYGFELIDGAPYLVLELVGGRDAGRAPASAAPCRSGEAVAVALQIAEALQEAHRKGVVHRDLKPANVKLADGRAREGPRLRHREAAERP